MPSKRAPRKPANRPPRNPGRLRRPPTGEDTGGRCANVPPGWLGCVMLRSMGRTLGDVAVDGGAEKVCEPRLPKLPPRPARALASVATSANTATKAQSVSSARERKAGMRSSQKTRSVPTEYWYPIPALEEVPHGVADGGTKVANPSWPEQVRP